MKALQSSTCLTPADTNRLGPGSVTLALQLHTVQFKACDSSVLQHSVLRMILYQDVFE